MCLAVFSMFPHDLTLLTFLNLWESHQIWKYFYHCFLKYFLPMSLLSLGDSNSTFTRPVEVVSRLIEALFHFSAHVFALYFKIWIIYITLLSFQPSIVLCKLQPAFVFLDSQFCICTSGDPWLC